MHELGHVPSQADVLDHRSRQRRREHPQSLPGGLGTLVLRKPLYDPAQLFHAQLQHDFGAQTRPKVIPNRLLIGLVALRLQVRLDDHLQPVVEPLPQSHVPGRRGDPAGCPVEEVSTLPVALVESLAVRVLALRRAVRLENVHSRLIPAVRPQGHRPGPVGVALALGRHQAASSISLTMKSRTASAGIRRARPMVMETSRRERIRS